MIPILYEKTETAFTTNGICRLTDCTSCFVTEERNGIYEVEFTYPVSGARFDDIQLGRIIGCTHDDNGDVQPFTIYAHSEPIDGHVTFYAHHISYELNAVTSAPFSTSGCANALGYLKTNSYTNNRFTFATDIVSSNSFKLEAPTPIRSALGGIEGSVIDTFGGEFKFDKFSVTLYANRGSNSGVSIRYAKNLVDYVDEVDYSETYNGVIPYWIGTDDINDEVTVIASAVISQTSTFTGYDRVIPYDFSEQFETKPTTNQLQTAATSFLASESPWLPNRNIEIEFAALWQTDEYKEYAAIEKVKLCDTIQVVFPAYNMSGTMKVVSVTYDVLSERYNKMELGKLSTTLSQAINAGVDGKIKEVDTVSKGALQIATNTNQYFWFTSTGNDTGAHITEKPKGEFLADPTDGGPNLLANSNGIAVRDGTTELAMFGATAAQVGANGSGHTIIEPHGLKVYGSDGNIELADIGYDLASDSSGTTSDAPYYVLGIPLSSAPAFDSTVSYKNGDVVSKDGVLYMAWKDVSAGAWNAGNFQRIPGKYGFVEGLDNVISDSCGHAEGRDNRVSGAYGHAEGRGNVAGNGAAHAEGRYSQALGDCSHAQNRGTAAYSTNQTALGKYNIIDYISKYAVIIGNGTADNARSNALTVDWDGKLTVQGHSTEIGYNTSSFVANSASISSGTTPQALSGAISLSAGTWILVGEAVFPYGSGYRYLDWHTTSSVLGSAVTLAGINVSGINTRMQSIAIVTPTTNTDYYLYTWQNSGSTMTVSYSWQAVRIA